MKRPEDLVFIDECGIDDNETPSSAYGPKGERVFSEKNATRTTRVSILSALNQNILMQSATMLFEGYCDRDVFEAYVEHALVPSLKEGQTVVLDNAAFHKGGRIASLINDAHCEVIYLPPYSPDLNPIEHHWNAVKNRIRKALVRCDRDIYKAAQYSFEARHVN